MQRDMKTEIEQQKIIGIIGTKTTRSGFEC